MNRTRRLSPIARVAALLLAGLAALHAEDAVDRFGIADIDTW